MPFKLDLGKKGFNMMLRPYQILAMEYLWKHPEEGGGSLDVYVAVNDELKMEGKSISRASIINSLNMLVDIGVLGFHEVTGKGGHRRIYNPCFDEKGFKRFIAETVIKKLLEEFPEETRKALV